MKALLTATVVATLLFAASFETSNAVETGPASLMRLALLLEKVDGLRGTVVGDSLVVSERQTNRFIYSVEVGAAGSLTFASTGTIGGASRQGAAAVDMSYLDASSVGVLTVDRQAGVWSLTHSVNPNLASIDGLRAVARRFADAVASTRVRFERELTVSDR